MPDRLHLERNLASAEAPLPPMLTGVIAVAAALVLGLVVLGCGSSSKSSTTKSSTAAGALQASIPRTGQRDLCTG